MFYMHIWWSIVLQSQLRAILRSLLKCASILPRTEARIRPLVFCAKCSRGDPLVGHFETVGSTAYVKIVC